MAYVEDYIICIIPYITYFMCFSWWQVMLNICVGVLSQQQSPDFQKLFCWCTVYKVGVLVRCILSVLLLSLFSRMDLSVILSTETWFNARVNEDLKVSIYVTAAATEELWARLKPTLNGQMPIFS